MSKKRVALAVLLTVVLVVSVGMEARRQIQYRENAAAYDDAVQIAGLAKVQGSRPEEIDMDVTDEFPPVEEESVLLADVDLEALQAVNPDVLGWISIPDTTISYPLLQTDDNRYYLRHNWKNESNKGGAVFLDASCASDFSDYHTIVYAHRMQDGSMFGSLPNYNNAAYWQAHPSVYVRVGNVVRRYDIFAAHTASVKGVVYRLDMEESGLEEEFLRTCLEQSVFETRIVPEKDAPVLTLSTCTETGYSKRWVVQAVLRDILPAE